MDHEAEAQQLIDASRRNLGARDREAAAIQAHLATAHATLHLAGSIERSLTGHPAGQENETVKVDNEGQ